MSLHGAQESKSGLKSQVNLVRFEVEAEVNLEAAFAYKRSF
jgi:hypothetical protein